jgi:hypothetical protein
MGRRVVIAACALVIPLFAAEGASACTCIAPSSEDVRVSDAAVIAKLTKVEVLDDSPASPSDPADYHFRIREIFKGEKRIDRKVIRVRSTIGAGGDCGMNGAVGRTYGLFLERRGGRWTGSSCGMTSPSQMRELAAGGTVRSRCAA